MKNKIIKTLESPKKVIAVTLLIAVIIAFFVYKNVGYAPKNINQDTEASLGNSRVQLKNGETTDLAFPKSGRVNIVNIKPGDTVKKGQILASLDSTDAQGALEIAKANYQKVLNGATGADVEVTKASVKTAQVNLDTVTAQQNLAVENAYKNLLNSNLEAIPRDDYNNSDYVAPVISGTYLLGKEGAINLELYNSAGGTSFSASGLAEGSGMNNMNISEPIGNSGLYIKFTSAQTINQTKWVINIPNKKATNYLANYNAYQTALQSQKNAVALAQASLDQANSALALKVMNARPEDVTSAEGALQIAQGAYDNDFIYAPTDGLITAVNIGAGEIAGANQRVISLIVNSK